MAELDDRLHLAEEVADLARLLSYCLREDDGEQLRVLRAQRAADGGGVRTDGACSANSKPSFLVGASIAGEG